jgi:hypothetical protein
MDNTIRDILLIFVFLLLLCAVFTIALVFLGIRRLQKFLAPDLADMTRRLDEMRRNNANLSDDALIQKIIQQQAFKCGVVGALSGLGGFITLPIALPADILLSTRIQSTMVQFIAMVYNQTATSNQELSAQTYLVLSGSAEVTQTTTKFIMRFIPRILGKSLSIAIPAFGAIVGFIVNYASAKVTGNLAVRWYGSGLTQPHTAIAR